MNRILIGFLKNTNKAFKALFPRAFNIEMKYPGGFPLQMTKNAAENIL